MSSDLLRKKRHTVRMCDGKDMALWLDEVHAFVKDNMLTEAEARALLLNHLRGEARRHVWVLETMKTLDDMQYEDLRKELNSAFAVSGQDLLDKLRDIRWQNDHLRYCRDFAEASRLGEEAGAFDPFLLELFMHKLPFDVVECITDSGREMPCNLGHAMQMMINKWGPSASLRQSHTFGREIQRLVALHKREYNGGDAGGYRRPPARDLDRSERRQYYRQRPHWETRRRRQSYDEDRVQRQEEKDREKKCTRCTGRGHNSTLCPTNDERKVRPGVVCHRCGGRDHFIRDCCVTRPQTYGQ